MKKLSKIQNSVASLEGESHFDQNAQGRIKGIPPGTKVTILTGAEARIKGVPKGTKVTILTGAEGDMSVPPKPIKH